MRSLFALDKELALAIALAVNYLHFCYLLFTYILCTVLLFHISLPVTILNIKVQNHLRLTSSERKMCVILALLSIFGSDPQFTTLPSLFIFFHALSIFSIFI